MLYLKYIGGAIWHPRCGPSPNENGTIINGGKNSTYKVTISYFNSKH